MAASLPVFRPWVPTWLIRVALLLGLAPGFILLGLYAGNLPDAAGYFGFEPSDLQFSILLYYVGLVAYFPLDARVSAFLPVRRYFALAAGLMLLSVWLCTLTTSLPVFLALRFVQGMCCVGVCSPCLMLIFSQLAPGRARAMGFSIFYGALLCSTSLCTIIAAYTLEHFSFPALFHVFALLQIPGALLLLGLLTNNRLQPHMPLYQLEWPSFVLYAGALGTGAYLLAYGQQRYWFEDGRLLAALGIVVTLLLAFVLRQQALKRPFLNLSVFGVRDFVLGLLLFGTLYLVRSSAGVASLYFGTVLKLDADYLTGLQVALMVGIVTGVAVAVRYVLVGTSLRTLWLVGFGLLLVHHVWMYCLFGPQRGPAEFLLPLLVQGLGNGLVLVPIVLFALTPLSPRQSPSGVFLAVGSRFAGFAGSLALNSYLQPWLRSVHYDRFRQEAVLTNPQLATRLVSTQQTLLSKGLAPDVAQRVATRLLSGTLETQGLLRYAMDYFALIGAVLVGLLLVLLVAPPLHRHYTSFRKRLQ